MSAQYIHHLANGKAIISATQLEDIYDTPAKRQELFIRANNSLVRGNFQLVLAEEHEELNAQEINYIDDATDMEYYNDFFGKEEGEEMNTKQLLMILTISWLRSNAPRNFEGGMGGGWNCGGVSGLWADFSVKVKAKDGFSKKHYCPFNSYFIGIRVCLDAEHRGANGTERFEISKFKFSYEPYRTAKTTILCPSFGGNWQPKKLEDKATRDEELREFMIQLAKHEDQKQKKLAEQKRLDEAKERQREWRAKLDAECAEAIAKTRIELEQIRKLKELNREVAIKNQKLADRKEADKLAKDAEKRHAEKLKQKEIERQKFVSKKQ
jgi:hypothetical protein